MTDANVPPTEYERLLEERRERERQRKRKFRTQQTPKQRRHERSRKRTARLRQSPEQRQGEVTRKRIARLRQTPEQRERERQRCRSRQRPFMAIDGEGGGTDYLGRQNYLLMVASGQTADEEIVRHRDGVPLTVTDCLEFILSLPKEAIIVGYGFGYDATQILRGISKAATLRRILDPPQGRNGPCYTYWGDYAILYQQGQYFRVARIDRSGPKPAIIKGSTRTIYEALGFFQCSFVDAIKKWKIGSEHERELIAKNKDIRDQFSELTKEIIEYCKLECRHLATLMTQLREVCAQAGISPKQWSGAGWLAAALLDQHGVPKRPLTVREAAALTDPEPARPKSATEE